MICNLRAQLVALVEKTFSLAGLARLDRSAKKALQLVKNVMRVASARKAPLSCTNVLLVLSAMLDRVSVHSAPPDRTASRGPRSPSFVNLDRTVQKARKNVKNVMREASVLEAHPSLRNVLLALTVMLGRTIVHYAPLAFSVTVDLKSLVLLDFTV